MLQFSSLSVCTILGTKTRNSWILPPAHWHNRQCLGEFCVCLLLIEFYWELKHTAVLLCLTGDGNHKRLDSDPAPLMLRKLNVVDIIVSVDVCVCLCRCALTMRGVWFSPCMRTILSARELCLRRILCSRTGRWDLLPSMSRTLPTAHYTTARVACVCLQWSTDSAESSLTITLCFCAIRRLLRKLLFPVSRLSLFLFWLRLFYWVAMSFIMFEELLHSWKIIVVIPMCNCETVVSYIWVFCKMKNWFVRNHYCRIAWTNDSCQTLFLKECIRASCCVWTC